jgi:hypothetical protein
MPYVDVVIAAPEILLRDYQLRRGVVPEVCATLAAQKALGEWQQTEDGPINKKGQSLEEYLAVEVKNPDHIHWQVQGEEVDRADAAWIGVDGKPPTLVAQGERVKEIGEKAAQAEAASYGTRLGNLKPGNRPGAPPKDGDDKSSAGGGATSNPWSKNFTGDQEQRTAKMQSIIKTSTRLAVDLARAAGVTLGGVPIRK